MGCFQTKQCVKCGSLPEQYNRENSCRIHVYNKNEICEHCGSGILDNFGNCYHKNY